MRSVRHMPVFPLIAARCADEGRPLAVIKVVPAFVILYGLMQSFGNAGPGDMLGLTSAESYATAVRGTCYGFSAAIGKVGAVVGTQTFTPIKVHLGQKYTFIVAACCGVVGMIVTYFFIRNEYVPMPCFRFSRRPLITIFIRHSLGGDLAEEDAKFEAYLASQGWAGAIGVHGKEALVDVEEDSKNKADQD